MKATGLAPSGGVAKRMIAAGEVRVDGQCELRKTCKIRLGARVELDDPRVTIDVRAAPGAS